MAEQDKLEQLDPYSEEARAIRARCSCSYTQYCGPGCGAHTE